MFQPQPWHVGAVPITEDEAIDNALSAYLAAAAKPFDLGVYANKARSTGVSAVGLIALEHLLAPMWQAQPVGRLGTSQLQRRIAIMCDDNAGLNSSTWGNNFFAKWAAVQICVMMSHVRRVMASTQRYKEACDGLTEEERVRFDGLMHACSTGLPAASDAPPDEPREKKPRRELKVQVSVDETGFPRLSCLADMEVEEKMEQSEDEEEDDGVEQSEDEEEEEEMEQIEPGTQEEPSNDLGKDVT